jgi:hypothetical protein
MAGITQYHRKLGERGARLEGGDESICDSLWRSIYQIELVKQRPA